MGSIFTGQGDMPAFRTSWRGYDRAEVDEFLRRTAADRQRLQEDLAQLEAFMARTDDERRELERLAAIRRDVASCLETSIGALRTATGLLASVTPPTVQPPAPAPVIALPIARETSAAIAGVRSLVRLRPQLLSWAAVARRKPMLVGVGSVAALMVAGLMYQNEPRASEIPSTPPAVDIQAAAPTAAPEPIAPAAPAAAISPAPPAAPPTAVVEREDGLVLTLTARRACWISTTLDGSQHLERMLVPNETIMLRATNEAVLRVGDATALAVLINNQPTRPLGTTGQVVTHKITRANYRNLLEN